MNQSTHRSRDQFSEFIIHESFRQVSLLGDIMNKYFITVSIPRKIESERVYNNFVKLHYPRENMDAPEIVCCNNEGAFTIYDTCEEATKVANEILKYHYLVEVYEYVT